MGNEKEDKGNPFNFFGEVIDDTGKQTGRNGKIVTFTGGSDTTTGWGASTARTLEEITANDVVKKIKDTGQFVLAVPHERRLGNNFGFMAGTKLPRFTINIQQRGEVLKSIFFIDVTVGPINPVIRKNLTLFGVVLPVEMLSVDVVRMSVNGSVSVPENVSVP